MITHRCRSQQKSTGEIGETSFDVPMRPAHDAKLKRQRGGDENERERPPPQEGGQREAGLQQRPPLRGGTGVPAAAPPRTRASPAHPSVFTTGANFAVKQVVFASAVTDLKISTADDWSSAGQVTDQTRFFRDIWGQDLVTGRTRPSETLTHGLSDRGVARLQGTHSARSW